MSNPCVKCGQKDIIEWWVDDDDGASPQGPFCHKCIPVDFRRQGTDIDRLTVARDAAIKERDEARAALRELSAAVEKANKVYLDEIATLITDCDCWKASHAGQQRNTEAAMADCDQLRAEVAALSEGACGESCALLRIELAQVKAGADKLLTEHAAAKAEIERLTSEVTRLRILCGQRETDHAIEVQRLVDIANARERGR